MNYNITITIGEYSFTLDPNLKWHGVMEQIFKDPDWIAFFKEYDAKYKPDQ